MGRQTITIDPAVAAIIKEGGERQRKRRMTTAQRTQAERDAKRRRVTLEINPHVAQMLDRIASEEGCSQASAANLLLCDAVGRYVEGAVQFNGNRRRSRSPRYEWVVEMDGEAEVVLASLERELESRGE